MYQSGLLSMSIARFNCFESVTIASTVSSCENSLRSRTVSPPSSSLLPIFSTNERSVLSTLYSLITLDLPLSETLTAGTSIAAWTTVPLPPFTASKVRWIAAGKLLSPGMV